MNHAVRSIVSSMLTACRWSVHPTSTPTGGPAYVQKRCKPGRNTFALMLDGPRGRATIINGNTLSVSEPKGAWLLARLRAFSLIGLAGALSRVILLSSRQLSPPRTALSRQELGTVCTVSSFSIFALQACSKRQCQLGRGCVPIESPSVTSAGVVRCNTPRFSFR